MYDKGKTGSRGASSRRFAALLAVIVVATMSMAVVLGACGGGSEDAESSQNETVHIGLLPNLALYLPLWVAQDKGYFAEEGVNIKTTTIAGGGADTLAALTGGSIDTTDLGFLMVAEANAKGLPMKFSCGNQISMPYVMMIRNGVSGTDPNAKWPEVLTQLKGKKIAISTIGSSNYRTLIRLLETAGMKESDVTIISAGTQTTAQFKSNQIDAAIVNEPDATMLEKVLKVAYPALDLRTPENQEATGLSGFIYDGWIAKAEIADQPRMIKMGKAMARGIEVIQDPATDITYLIGLTKSNLKLEAPDEIIGDMIKGMMSSYAAEIPPEKIEAAWDVYGLDPQPYETMVGGVAAGAK